jgi:hypothetical protein
VHSVVVVVVVVVVFLQTVFSIGIDMKTKLPTKQSTR